MLPFPLFFDEKVWFSLFVRKEGFSSSSFEKVFVCEDFSRLTALLENDQKVHLVERRTVNAGVLGSNPSLVGFFLRKPSFFPSKTL